MRGKGSSRHLFADAAFHHARFGIIAKRCRTIVDVLDELHIELETLHHRYHVHILQDSPAVIIVSV